MRLIMFYDNGTINPVVVNKSKFTYRFDILKPDSVTLTDLQRGKAYGKDEILTSIIYNGFANTRFTSGPRQLFDKIVKHLPKDVLREMLMDLRFQEDIEFGDGSKLRVFGFNGTAGTSSKITKMDYSKEAKRLLSGDISFYANKEVKTLEYFKATKEIDFDGKDYRCLYTMEAVREYVNSENWEDMLGAVDTETTGFEFFYNLDKPDEIVGMSHSYKSNSGVFIQFRYKGDQLLDPAKALTALKPILEAKNVYQNGSFDYRVFRRYGFKVNVHWELTNILQLTNPDPLVSKALKPVAKILLGEDVIELDEILGVGFDAKMVEWIDRDLITFYACGDTDKTLTIAKRLYDELPKITQELFDFDCYNYREVCTADWYGFPANKELLQSVHNGVLQDKLNAENYILEYVYAVAPAIQAKKLMERMGVSKDKITQENIVSVMATEEFNRMLSKKMHGVRQEKFELDYDGDKARILYELLDYPHIRYTPTGALSTGKVYFIDLCNYKLKESSEIVKKDLLTSLDDKDENGDKYKLISMNEVNNYAFPMGYMLLNYAIICNKLKIYSRLLSNYSNGRTFDTYRYTNTNTGRLSSSVHTIAGYAKGIIGHKPESKYGMLSFDADQIELRGVHNEAIRMWDAMLEMPEVKNDKNNPLNKYSYQKLVDIFNDYEADPHTETIAMFNQISVKDVTPVIRSRGKTVVFSGAYGAHSSTMAKGELALAKSEKERDAIREAYANIKNAWLDTNLHLLNYFDMTKDEALYEIPLNEIPFNYTSEHVGKTMTRSGRRRFYVLDAPKAKLGKISNQGRNQFIQSYMRDVIFIAISNLSKAMRAEGFDDEDFRGILFVHDEEGVEYNKEKINPLWLAAMTFKHCCIEVEGHKIKYYVSPAIVNNWAEGKSDKYEIPKKMLEKLSTNKGDYELLGTLNHRDYMLDKIFEYYRDEMVQIFEDNLIDDIVVGANVDTMTRYSFFKKSKHHRRRYKEVVANNDLNLLFGYVANSDKAEAYKDVKITFRGQEYRLSDFLKEQEVDTEIDELDFDEFEAFDSAEEFEAAQQLLSYDDAIKTVVNSKTIAELNDMYGQASKKEEKAMKNILLEKYFSRATILLGRNNDGALNKDSITKINGILKEVAVKQGVIVNYYIDGGSVESGIVIPPVFDLEKFDKFITKLRRKG